MILLFGNDKGEPIDIINNNLEVVSFPTTHQEAGRDIMLKLEEMEFKSYYQRQSIIEEDIIWIDYGSHINFFYLTDH